MQRERILAAVCGSQRIVVALVRPAPDSRFAVEHARAVPVASSASLNDALRALVDVPGFNSAAAARALVVVAPPPREFLLKTIAAPDTTPEAQAAVLRFEAEQAWPFPLETPVWTAQRTGRTANAVEFLLAAAKREALTSIADAVTTRRNREIRLVPLALAQAAHATDDTSCAQLWLDPAMSVLVVRSSDRMHVRQIAHATLEPDDPAWPERAATDVARTLAVLRRQVDHPLPSEFELTGAGPLCGAMTPLLAQKLGPAGSVRSSPAVFTDESGSGLASTELAAAVRLAAAALADRDGKLNLLPRACVNDRKARRVWWALAAAVAFAPAGWSWRITALTAEDRAETRALAAEIAPLRRLADERRANEAELQRLQAKLAALDRSDASRLRWPRLLSRLGTAVAGEPALWLERLEPIAPTVTPTPSATGLFDGATAANDQRDALRLRLSGCTERSSADSVAAVKRVHEFLGRLLAADGPAAAADRVRLDDSQPGRLRFELEITVRETPAQNARATGP